MLHFLPCKLHLEAQHSSKKQTTTKANRTAQYINQKSLKMLTDYMVIRNERNQIGTIKYLEKHIPSSMIILPAFYII